MQKELGREVDLSAVAQSVLRKFGDVFDRQMVRVEPIDALIGNTVGVPLRTPDELRRLRGDDEVFVS
jgi:hypothetical protein